MNVAMSEEIEDLKRKRRRKSRKIVVVGGNQKGM